MSRPKLVGKWIFQVTNGGAELIKIGEDGDCKKPLPPKTSPKNILKELEYLQQNNENDYFFVAHVFSNGCIKHFDYQPTEA